MPRPLTSTTLSLALVLLTALSTAHAQSTGRGTRIAAGAIAGIVIGGLALCLFFIICCVCCFRRRRTQRRGGGGRRGGVLAGPGGAPPPPMRTTGGFGGLGRMFGRGRTGHGDPYAHGYGGAPPYAAPGAPPPAHVAGGRRGLFGRYHY